MSPDPRLSVLPPPRTVRRATTDAGFGVVGGLWLCCQPVGAQEQTPLANLYTSMLQRMGFELDAFSLGTGRLAGLEWT
ncbi:MAG: hypothetical protein WCH37_06185 [Synechococcaceae cyanobacterium ELA182]